MLSYLLNQLLGLLQLSAARYSNLERLFQELRTYTADIFVPVLPQHCANLCKDPIESLIPFVAREHLWAVSRQAAETF